MTVGLHEHADSREIYAEKFHEKLARQFHGGKRAKNAGSADTRHALRVNHTGPVHVPTIHSDEIFTVVKILD
ncbi:hypothetical protein F3J12_23755 [Burkholderia sp. Ax-1735]|uniref:hypothetical protein n=1 Tax=Burkholderia sp. Ax-1735 TaxID=2608329 RepID=UPI00141DA963|nr:hypothetical protein [Burkholderia sp. Ax-1735]NIF12477.1 hypothetical protein [Burkholderia sp. Ax-1735]NIG05732.1 hypothetical protein [Burkholderia sp. Tr-849]